jgi:putative ATP-dependent endonuclease of OLD family
MSERSTARVSLGGSCVSVPDDYFAYKNINFSNLSFETSMHIESVALNGYRNFRNSDINFSSKSLIIGANDIGKTNLILALRLLLDRSFSEQDIEPSESDFHINERGIPVEYFEITIRFANVVEDAVLSIFSGAVGADGKIILRFSANRISLEYKIYVGRSEIHLNEVTSRFYLRHLCMKVVDSRRDLTKFIQSEKRYLLKLAQELRTTPQIDADNRILEKVGQSLNDVNNLVGQLHYVSSATNDVNSELKALAHHHSSYSVKLNSVAIEVAQFVEKLELAGSTNGSKVLLGGDGRNNQILLALWKAKSMREFDADNEVVIYCVEEPGAHLHPHQQRRLAAYLSQTLTGQTLVTTHSPQIVSGYSPDSIIRLKMDNGATHAASGGCSPCIHSAWDHMGYRMSILPSEAFFASVVLLVEGPSELLFYRQFAEKIGIDLDFYNISILSVDGVQFEVYAQILKAMEIKFVVRTDNDISKILLGPLSAQVEHRQLAGFNRCRRLAGAPILPHMPATYAQLDSVNDGTWTSTSSLVNPNGIFISKFDLEVDMSLEFPDEFMEFQGGSVSDTVAYLQKNKAMHMREFLIAHGVSLKSKGHGELAKPLHMCVKIATQEIL